MPSGMLLFLLIFAIIPDVVKTKDQFTRNHLTDCREVSKKMNNDDKACFDSSMPLRITATEGDIAVLPCIVQNVDFTKTTMSWWKESIPHELSMGIEVYNDRHRIEKRGNNNWSLVINRSVTSDSGYYICQINSIHLKERFIELIVEEYPKRSISQNDGVHEMKPPGDNTFIKNERMPKKLEPMRIEGSKVVHEGSSISLRCIASFERDSKDNPSSLTNQNTIKWILPRNNQRSSTESKNVSYKWIDQTQLISDIRIDSATMEMRGLWTCKKIINPRGPFEEKTVYVNIISNKELGKRFWASNINPVYRPEQDTDGANQIRFPVMIYLSYFLFRFL